MKSYQKAVQLLCLGVLFSQTDIFAQTGINTQLIPQEQNALPAQGVKQNLQNLFVVHGQLLNEAIVDALNNAPVQQIEQGKSNLKTNAHEIANLLVPIYGQQVAQWFENLFDKHIAFGSAYINAIKANDQASAERISQQALSNGRAIANFLSRVNPSIPYEINQKMWEAHVQLEAQQTRAYFQRDPQATQLKDQSLKGLIEMANIIGNAFQNR